MEQAEYEIQFVEIGDHGVLNLCLYSISVAL